jgi:hypothetical protein
MDPTDVYKFDLRGCIVLRGVLNGDEVAAANAMVDTHASEMAGLESAQDMLGWPGDERSPFVAMLAHPRIVPYLNCLCGPGFRMDHAPTLIVQDKGGTPSAVPARSPCCMRQSRYVSRYH